MCGGFFASLFFSDYEPSSYPKKGDPSGENKSTEFEGGFNSHDDPFGSK
jgi:hypothetical protein